MPLCRLALGLALAAAASAAPAFTLEQILSSPFPTNMTASPHGDAIAWTADAKGLRNVWVATAPTFEARPVTHFTSDDGQELSEIAWKPDATGLYFTRGGNANGRGEFPNPNSNPAGVHQEIWFASINSSDSHKVADGNGPAVSFDSATLAWIQNGQIWSAATTDSKPAQLTHARGAADQLTWSPKTHQLAFRSVRTDHSFIGIYDADTKQLRFPDPSVDRDELPAWSPDGAHVAFIRLAASRYASMHGAKRTGEPWSIRVADTATGTSKEIWHAAEGKGSVFWPINADAQLFWSTTGRVAFPWERDGWLHLYSVPSTGGEATVLTPGEYEVEHAAASADGRSIVYSSNQSDADRRHLWQVPISGGPALALTKGTGLEWAPASLANNNLAFFHSDAKSPARIALLESGKTRDLTALPSDFPTNALALPQQVIFPAADGLAIHGQIFLPPPGTATKHAAVIFFHGGSRRQMLLGWHNMFYYHQAYGFNQYLASKGFVVLSVNYRSGIGYGEEFREALNYGPTGASEYNDVIGAGLFMKSRTDVDASRIGLWGGSYGGYLTALGLARASNLFAAGVDLHGVHDWNLEISNPIPVFEPERRLDVARLAFQSSPMAYVESWKSPVLLIHGDDDRNVPFSETVQLAEALRKNHVDFEQLIFPDEIHDFLIHADWLRAYHAADEFLSRHLMPPSR